MSYNLHPIFVHFPIALLTIYSIIKILPFDRWFPKVSWRHIERTLLVVGVGGAFLALGTGENAEHLAQPNHQLVEMHSFFADLATWLYGALLLGEVLFVLNSFLLPKISIRFISKTWEVLERILCKKTFSKIIAFVALVAISITGLLGGVMVYGTTADPFAQIILNILNINL